MIFYEIFHGISAREAWVSGRMQNYIKKSGILANSEPTIYIVALLERGWLDKTQKKIMQKVNGLNPVKNINNCKSVI